MKRLSWCYLAVLVLSLSPNLWAGDASDTRLAGHKEALGYLEDLHFFEGGRGINLTPDLMGFYAEVKKYLVKGPVKGIHDEVFRRRWGMTVEQGKVMGFVNVPYKNMDVGVFGCVACHSSKAAGVYYIGLGNKNIDIYQIAQDAKWVQRLWNLLPRKPGVDKKDYQQVMQSARAVSNQFGVGKTGNLTQGMFPGAVIFEWFYNYHHTEQENDNLRGQVKVPMWWGYGEKVKAGQYADGFIDSTKTPGGIVMTELVVGQTPETMRAYMPKVMKTLQEISKLLPPKYPFAVDAALAQVGQKVFEDNCSKCHGTYAKDERGYPVYQAPKFVRLDQVGTDSDRTMKITPELLSYIGDGPWADMIQPNEQFQPGYYSPRLHGIWARFPYLHNASVPTLRAILTVPEQRPRVFSLYRISEAERFTKDDVGATYPARDSREERNLLSAARRGDREVYSIARQGHSNQGHPFGTSLPDEQKRAVIEYLKTL